MLGLLFAATAHAQGCDTCTSAPARAIAEATTPEAARASVEVRTLPVAPGATNRTPAFDNAYGGRRIEPAAARDLDVRLWLRRGSTSVGAGLQSELVETTTAPATSALRAADGNALAAGSRAFIVGVRYKLSDTSGIYADRVGTSTQNNGLPPVNAEGPVRVGLEFKSAKSNLAGLPHGSLFRVQLSSDSNLSIRPKKGGMHFTLRAKW